MGSPAEGIAAWYWRANHQFGESLSFHGFATEARQPGPPILTSAQWSEGRWSVVIGAPMAASQQCEQVGFAVWEGGSQERAGLHSFTPEWQELSIA
jgi:DMSO reductase family type II enzyme heme b subunit